VEPSQTVLAARALGVSPMIFVRAISGVFLAAGGMCLAVLALRGFLVDADVPAAGRLVLCIAFGVVVYTGLCLWRVPELVAELRGLLGRRGGAGVPLAAAPAES
jgi:hypothetical protein